MYQILKSFKTLHYRLVARFPMSFLYRRRRQETKFMRGVEEELQKKHVKVHKVLNNCHKFNPIWLIHLWCCYTTLCGVVSSILTYYFTVNPGEVITCLDYHMKKKVLDLCVRVLIFHFKLWNGSERMVMSWFRGPSVYLSLTRKHGRWLARTEINGSVEHSLARASSCEKIYMHCLQ